MTISKPCSRQIHQKRRAQERGTGLIEVTVSLLIVNIGLLALAQLFGVAVWLNHSSRNSTMKARAAQETIELLKATAYSGVAEGTTNVLYKNKYAVSTHVEDTGLEMKKITVTVEETGILSKTGRGNKSIFVVYQNNPQPSEGPLYNSLADPKQCGKGTSTNSGSSGNSNSGSGS